MDEMEPTMKVEMEIKNGFGSTLSKLGPSDIQGEADPSFEVGKGIRNTLDR